MTSVIRTSITHPLRIASCAVGDQGGAVGVTFAPVKHQAKAMTGMWQRDLTIGTAIVVTQGRHFTHDHDATLLDSRLRELIYAANDSGYVWHSIAEKHVYTARYPHQAQHR